MEEISEKEVRYPCTCYLWVPFNLDILPVNPRQESNLQGVSTLLDHDCLSVNVAQDMYEAIQRVLHQMDDVCDIERLISACIQVRSPAIEHVPAHHTRMLRP